MRSLAGGAFRRSIALTLFLLAWELLPRWGVFDQTFLTPFTDVLRELRALAENGTLWTHVSVSLQRALLGFAIALGVGIPLGLLIGWYRYVGDVLSPLITAAYNTAPLALLPVFILLLGIGEISKVAIVVWACVFPIALNTITGVRTVDPLLVKSARSLGLGPLALFRKIVLPAAVPTIFTGVRMGGTYSVLVLVAAEMVGAKSGLGFLITSSQFNFQIPSMYAGIFTISCIGITVNVVLVRIERRFSRWRPETNGGFR